MKVLRFVGLLIGACFLFLVALVGISGESLLTVAVTTKNPIFVKAVLPFSSPDEVGPQQHPAIVVAAYSGHDVIVGILLDAEVNPNLAGPDGTTALSVATKKGFNFVARKLIARGANPNIADQNGRTPLSFAAQLGRDSLARDLIHNEAELDLADAKGNPPLYYSIVTGNHGITRDLVEMKAQVNWVNNKGRTPLHAAWQTWRHSKAISPNLERVAISYLVEHGLNPAIRDKSNQSLQDELVKTPYEKLLSRRAQVKLD